MCKYIQFYDIWETVYFPLKERIVAISLLFVLFAPVITIYTYLQYEKSAIRREIKWKMIAGMNQEELVLLKFTKEEINTKLRWEHSKEFEYNGQMYDIVSKEVIGDYIFYRVWWDHEETKLNKNLKKLVAVAFSQDEERNKAQMSLYVYLESFFFNDIFDWKAKPSQKLWVVYQNTLHPEIFNSFLLSPPKPPPKFS